MDSQYIKKYNGKYNSDSFARMVTEHFDITDLEESQEL